jgi:hypothetical protein
LSKKTVALLFSKGLKLGTSLRKKKNLKYVKQSIKDTSATVGDEVKDELRKLYQCEFHNLHSDKLMKLKYVGDVFCTGEIYMFI